MSQTQAQTASSEVTALEQLTLTWQALPICSALIELDIRKHIPADGSSVDVEQLAQAAAVDAGMLYRFMRFVSSLGIFEERDGRKFAHNKQSKSLLPDSKSFTFYYLRIHCSSQESMLPAAQYIAQLREPSKPAFERALGCSFFEYLAKSPEHLLEKLYADFLTVNSEKVRPDILEAIKLPDEGIVADVGGGHGHDLLVFLEKYPKLRGVVFELPTVAKLVGDGLRDPNDSTYSKYPAALKQRVTTAAGSYLNSDDLKQIADADVFYFKWIFHDNNDADCRKILAALHQVMKRTAQIVICDSVYTHSRNRWEYDTALDLLMAVLLNGKQRTREDWTQLLSNNEGDFSYKYYCTLSPVPIATSCRNSGRWDSSL